MSPGRRIAVCIATFRRPGLLQDLLDSVERQQLPQGAELEIRVVDNDPAASAARAVAGWCRRRVARWPLRYELEPEPGISAARNRALEIGPADAYWFIDDDEVADPDCLARLLATLDREQSDAAFGFIGGSLPPQAPAWMSRGAFFDHPTGTPGRALSWRGTRCGNTLLRGALVNRLGFRFHREFGRTGAEDVEFFARLARAGARYSSAPLAVARETVPADRARWSWLLRRAFRSGACFERLRAGPGSGRHPFVQGCCRSARGGLRLLGGIAVLAMRGPELLVRGSLDLALAAGGWWAWLVPSGAAGLASYGSGGGRAACASRS